MPTPLAWRCTAMGSGRPRSAALEKSIGISGYSSFDGFFLAMAREKLGESEKARAEYDRAVEWMKQVKPKDDELRRFRAEAAELLQIKDLPASKP